MVTRREAVWASLAYRYHNPRWDMDRNRAIYGDDHSVEGVGANMTIWLEAGGELDPKTSLLLPERSLARHLAAAKNLLDHRCLFNVESWFESKVPTPENIAFFIMERIGRMQPPAGRWTAVVLEENDRWSFLVRPGSDRLLLCYRSSGDDSTMELHFEGVPDLESGLLIRRSELIEAVQSIKTSQPDSFFMALQSRLPMLNCMRVEESRRRAWELRSSVTFSP